MAITIGDTTMNMMVRKITEEERAMLNDRHSYDDMCDCSSCKAQLRRQMAIDYMDEIDRDDGDDDYYRFNGSGFEKVYLD
jgi:hypothetical protein